VGENAQAKTIGGRPFVASRSRIFLVSGLLAACVVGVGLAVQHERSLGSRAVQPAALASQAGQPALPLLQKALTGAEEDYAAALWDIHKEVKVAAVSMTFAGLAYKTGGQSLHDLEARVRPVANALSVAEFRVRALNPPASLQGVQDTYAEAVSLYQQASDEMLKAVTDGQEQHLVEGQAMAQRASEDLLRVGDVLWPGEYKPN
jgi:hypothetical protein